LFIAYFNIFNIKFYGKKTTDLIIIDININYFYFFIF